MIPLSLKLKGFLSYKEQAAVDLSLVEVACVSGPNGAGKSSLFDAITWVLFGHARRSDDALINDGAESCYVALEFAYENDRYLVQREKPREKGATLEFQILTPQESWKPLTEAGLRATEERIREVLRLDYDTFVNASFFLQGKADMFTQQPSGRRKEILSNILGLEVWESYREEAGERRRGAVNEVKALRALLDEVVKELGEEDGRVERLRLLQGNLDKTAALRQEKEQQWSDAQEQLRELRIQEEKMTLLQSQVKSSRARLDKTVGQAAERSTELESHEKILAEADQIEKSYTDWQHLRAEMERWNEKAAAYHRLHSQRSELDARAQAEAAKLRQELNGLQEAEREIAEIEKKLPQSEEQLADFKKELARLEEEISRLPGLETELAAQQGGRADLKAENQGLHEKMDEIKVRIENLKAAEGASCPLCGQDLSEDHRKEMLAQLMTEGKELGDRYRENLKAVQVIESEIVEINKSIRSLQQKRSLFSEKQSAFGRLSQQVDDFSARLIKWGAEGKDRLVEVRQILKAESYASVEQEKMHEIDQSIEGLGYDAEAHEKVRAAEIEARGIEEKFRTLEKARTAVDGLRREIAALEDGKATIGEETKNQAKQIEELKIKNSTLQEKIPDTGKLQKELNEFVKEENQLRREVGGAQQMVDILDFQRKRQKELNIQIKEQSCLIAQLKTLETAFGKDGIPALLIEQALPDIESQANDILDRLSDGRMSVSFETERDYKDKSREDKRQTLDILISDASGRREYELFSGGEAFRINFAIRLALSRVLAGRAGARLQTLVIDEGFGSQDAEGRQRLIEAINLVSPDFAKILVITHLEDLKDAFPSRIEVRKEASGSRVEVIP